MERLELPDVSRLAREVLDEVEVAVVGKREALTLVFAAILAGGHVLLEDFPGLGKTLAARSFAQTLGLNFARAQFTPDLLPADLTGSFVYDQRSGEFSFRRGPLFTGLLLADEINRCWRRCRSTRSPSKVRRSCWSNRSTCSPRRIRSSTRAPIRSPKPNSTGS
jgi:MoxR-like ATPase